MTLSEKANLLLTPGTAVRITVLPDTPYGILMSSVIRVTTENKKYFYYKVLIGKKIVNLFANQVEEL